MKIKNYCINCDKKISKNAKRCPKCAGKVSGKKQKGQKLTKEHIRKISGKNASHYIDGRCSKKYYCKKCGEETTYPTWFRGSKLCRKCAGILHSKKMKTKYKKIQHPNFKHGCAYCIDCAKKGIKTKIKFGCERCKKCWDKFNTGKNHVNFGLIPKPKWGKYKGINMRSSWEIAFAEYLDKQGRAWIYEPQTFNLGNTTYTPDFYLLGYGQFIEIKGYFPEKARKKIKLFKKQYPKERLQILQGKELNNLGIKIEGRFK